MNVAVLYQSLRGGTERAAEKIAEEFVVQGANAGAYPVTNFDAQFVLKADLIVIGTWTDGLFGLAARPAQLGKLATLPSIAHKPTSVFVTYEISAKQSLAKLADWAERQGADVVARAGIHRRRLNEGVADFVSESLEALDTADA
ncbi:MAG: flavodoxin domain-containing protein [Actinomycetota bacterium]